VFGYDANRIRLWAPDDSNAGNTNGYIIIVGDGVLSFQPTKYLAPLSFGVLLGWAGEVNAIYEKVFTYSAGAIQSKSCLRLSSFRTDSVSARACMEGGLQGPQG
jgi:hypothetical protein